MRVYDLGVRIFARPCDPSLRVTTCKGSSTCCVIDTGRKGERPCDPFGGRRDPFGGCRNHFGGHMDSFGGRSGLGTTLRPFLTRVCSSLMTASCDISAPSSLSLPPTVTIRAHRGGGAPVQDGVHCHPLHHGGPGQASGLLPQSSLSVLSDTQVYKP